MRPTKNTKNQECQIFNILCYLEFYVFSYKSDFSDYVKCVTE